MVRETEHLQIVYDENKNQKNISKHRISIPELATIFDNPYIKPKIDILDKGHSDGEKRYWAFGWTTSGWYVWVWYTYRGTDTIRIIGGKKLK